MVDISSNSNDLKQVRQTEGNVWREEERRELASLGIGFDGRYYRYKEYCYDLCSDAVSYAQLEHSKSLYREKDSSPPLWKKPEGPTDKEQRLMAEFGVTFDGKRYRYETYVYDRLVDAIHYAGLERQSVRRTSTP
jgi:hypothetical protein